MTLFLFFSLEAGSALYNSVIRCLYTPAKKYLGQHSSFFKLYRYFFYFQTAQAIYDFSREGLPLIILANWRGFSGGMKDMFDQVRTFCYSSTVNREKWLKIKTFKIFFASI